MSVTSPNMNLVLSTVGYDSGLNWETNLNASLTTVDSHNHSPGQGVPIQPNGININSALAFNNQAATGLASVVFNPQSSLATLTALYTKSDGNLYYNDGAGNVIKFTSSGSVNASSSGISSGSATAAFSSGVLVVNSNTNTPANIQGGSLLLGNLTAGSQYLTLNPPSAMASSFSLTLPSIPAAQNFLSIDTSGNIAAYAAVSGGITRPNLAAVGQQISGSSGTFSTSGNSYVAVTNLSVTITTSGRPVMLFLQGDGTTAVGGSGGSFVEGAVGSGVGFQIPAIGFFRGGTLLSAEAAGEYNSSTGSQYMSPGSYMHLDSPSAGTYTYSVQGYGGTGLDVYYCKLVAYEL